MVLYFVAAYYFLFLKKTNQFTFIIFITVGYTPQSPKNGFMSIIPLGNTDRKTAISAGMRKRLLEFDGIERLSALLAIKRGVCLQRTYGNFELPNILADLMITSRSTL